MERELLDLAFDMQVPVRIRNQTVISDRAKSAELLVHVTPVPPSHLVSKPCLLSYIFLLVGTQI